jgi:hypothetical protein
MSTPLAILGIVLLIVLVARHNEKKRRERRNATGLPPNIAPNWSVEGMRRDASASDKKEAAAVAARPTQLAQENVLHSEFQNYLIAASNLEDVVQSHHKYINDGGIPNAVPRKHMQETDHPVDANQRVGLAAVQQRDEWVGKIPVTSGSTSVISEDTPSKKK